MKFFHRVFLSLCFFLLAAAAAQAQLTPDLQQKIDQVATQALTKTGTPSASIAVVKDGQIVYVKAYGEARIDAHRPATPMMRYSIGSISKQFTAASLLFLQEQGKLSLDDKVAKYIPNLTRANEVTLRQLLSHTSGYQDYWPQDYVMPMMLQPVTAEKIMERWARIPLDFEPGTKWQYSNTNFVIAGAIVEKVARKPFFEFLREKVFAPLQMKSVLDIDQERLVESDPVGYMRFAIGPPRPAPQTGKGWLFAAGELAMTAEDLAKWDISILQQKLLKPVSYQQLGTEVLLKNGVGSRYGLGVSVGSQAGHRSLSHGGEVSGFTAENIIFPDDRLAVVALTNLDAANASGMIANGIASLLLANEDAATPQKLAQARKIFEGLQQGTIDRSLFTDNANSYFSELALKDFASSLTPLGTPQSFQQVGQSLRGGMTLRIYLVRFAQKTLRVWTFEMPDGKLEQYQVAEQG